ncbi:MAG: DUF1549 domain-containing protein [Pirellulaceae bacterium]|nr:DUF1549 domain-containing protein [Pirellulaceae bacterium]
MAFVLTLVFAAGPVDFDTEVLPVLTKGGCNAGACHGAAAGRGGFKLSLFGGDPAADWRAIVQELEGRRVNLAHPHRSLLLQKPTLLVDHEGGERFSENSPFARLLSDWIAAGAPRGLSRRLSRVEIEPSTAVVPNPPAELKLQVSAHFDDGSERDVTHLAVYVPADPAATRVSDLGEISVQRPGRHAVVVRFLTDVQAIQITAPFPLAGPARDPPATASHWIDREIDTTLAELRLPRAPRADDATLLRRITLDLTGRLPAPDRVRGYLNDGDPDKFAAEARRLLASAEFSEYWTYQLARWLRVRTGPNDEESTRVYHAWLHAQVRRDQPLNKLAAELLTATGPTREVGPASFHRTVGDARAEAEHVAESLLAIRLRCANCHNHPLDRWTQDDYHGLAAIFARLDRGPVVSIRSTGDVIHPLTGEPAIPRIPGDRDLPPEMAGRQAFLADWVADPANPYFAQAWANRLWQSLLGRGLVEPSDDLRPTNPASHPALIAKLARSFAAHDFRLRPLLQEILLSEAYQRSASPPKGAEHDDRFHSHALAKPLPAEVLLDAISDATGIPSQFRDSISALRREPASPQPAGTRAIALYTPQLAAEALGPLAGCTNPARCSGADIPPTLDDLAVQLHWLNGPLVNAKLADRANAFHQLAASPISTKKLIEEYYLRTLSRLPSAAEAKFWHAELAGTGREKKCEDFAWSLLGSREFVSNH